MDGMRARRGQPQAANHWCFNRHLNAVNLAPGNGGAGFWKKTKKHRRWVRGGGLFFLFFLFFTEGEDEKDEKTESIQKTSIVCCLSQVTLAQLRF